MRRWSALVVSIAVWGLAACGGTRAADVAGDAVVVLVRHAEKLPGDDPGLSEEGASRARALAHALSEWGPDAIYVSGFRRTRETAAPVAEAHGIEPEVVDAADVAGLAERIRAGDATRVLVVGHSNTVPAIVRALGAGEPHDISDEVYDDLFVVTLPGDGGAPGLLHLKYGARTPG